MNPKGLEGIIQDLANQGLAMCGRMAQNSTAGWQPIATAPKDGTSVLVFRLHESGYSDTCVAYFEGNYWRVSNYCCADMLPGGHEPTHWMPLPEPPK